MQSLMFLVCKYFIVETVSRLIENVTIRHHAVLTPKW